MPVLRIRIAKASPMDADPDGGVDHVCQSDAKVSTSGARRRKAGMDREAGAGGGDMTMPESSSQSKRRKLVQDCVPMNFVDPRAPRGEDKSYVVMLSEKYTPYPKRGVIIENICGMFSTFVEIGMLRGLIVDTITPFGLQHMLFHVAGNVIVDQGRGFFKACRYHLLYVLVFACLASLTVPQGLRLHRRAEPVPVPGAPDEPGAHAGAHGAAGQTGAGRSGWVSRAELRAPQRAVPPDSPDGRVQPGAGGDHEPHGAVRDRPRGPAAEQRLDRHGARRGDRALHVGGAELGCEYRAHGAGILGACRVSDRGMLLRLVCL